MLDVALTNEDQRSANLGENGMLAPTFDPLSAVAELFDQRERSVRDTSGLHEDLLASLRPLKAMAELFGELGMSHQGRADQREQWRAEIDTAINTAGTAAGGSRVRRSGSDVPSPRSSCAKAPIQYSWRTCLVTPTWAP